MSTVMSSMDICSDKRVGDCWDTQTKTSVESTAREAVFTLLSFDPSLSLRFRQAVKDKTGCERGPATGHLR